MNRKARQDFARRTSIDKLNQFHQLVGACVDEVIRGIQAKEALHSGESSRVVSVGVGGLRKTRSSEPLTVESGLSVSDGDSIDDGVDDSVDVSTSSGREVVTSGESR